MGVGDSSERHRSDTHAPAPASACSAPTIASRAARAMHPVAKRKATEDSTHQERISIDLRLARRSARCAASSERRYWCPRAVDRRGRLRLDRDPRHAARRRVAAVERAHAVLDDLLVADARLIVADVDLEPGLRLLPRVREAALVGAAHLAGEARIERNALLTGGHAGAVFPARRALARGVLALRRGARGEIDALLAGRSHLRLRAVRNLALQLGVDVAVGERRRRQAEHEPDDRDCASHALMLVTDVGGRKGPTLLFHAPLRYQSALKRRITHAIRRVDRRAACRPWPRARRMRPMPRNRRPRRSTRSRPR